ncbi:hypothetical protein Pyn_39387 [Prunus yedoensis var. nudiflora]|uniref:Uncharacterized protein n=1 Tax=Prunus yedoensis var. nudiflora TaxID=2094558 RepID=A0A314ZBE2_PRUYE|nr:hypothetical protein Pyn_39387 [Prunus yedoensis var. nudiflora]
MLIHFQFVPQRKEQECQRYLAGDTYAIDAFDFETLKKKTKMAKPSVDISESFASTAKISGDISQKDENTVLRFLKIVGVSGHVPDQFDAKKDSYSDLVRDLLKPLHISRGHVTCLVSVKPAKWVVSTPEVGKLDERNRTLFGISLEDFMGQLLLLLLRLCP